MSEHIRNLEDQLDCKLFDRLGRSIMPTIQAETLYPKAAAILEDLKQLKDEVSSAGSTVAGELTIGASTIPGTYLLPKYAAAFKKKYPKIIFETQIKDSTRTASAIHDKRLLLAIVGSKTFSRKIEFTPLCEDQLIVIANPENPIPARIKLESLGKYPFITRETGSGTRRNMEKIFTNAGFSPNQLDIVASFGSSTAVKEAVKTNLGIAIVSRYAVETELKMGWLREIQLKDISMNRTFYIAKLAKRSLPRQYQAFYNFLLQQHQEPETV
ncbi:related to transcriptional regulator protein [Desulfotalea psychrophila LSv54]|uniref:Related to transcriptional regulator protein n=1 Tax=Desulfotalea psychrophila (strain LSv54 / DSM 12343) TaxID=177439 RepID=Q6ANV6_DESPS|nr:related to transcriptional regulator protein [Desulfotalea psychrophila LSv54]